MTFLFQCPQCANVLQAHEAQAGQHCHCPVCQALFIIPAPVVPKAQPVASLPSPMVTPSPPTDSCIAFPPVGQSPEAGPPVTTSAPPPSPATSSGSHPASPQSPAQRPSGAPTVPPQTGFHVREVDLLHIPCPQCGKVLETPVEMLHQNVVCPGCDAPFCLHLRDSLEYKKKVEQQKRIQERRTNRGWLIVSIVVAVLALALVVYLILSSPGA